MKDKIEIYGICATVVIAGLWGFFCGYVAGKAGIS
jgi:hypothetical protein